MNFTGIQQLQRDLIASHVFFSANAAKTVFVDLGQVKTQSEAALTDVTTPLGYAVLVWPAMKFSATDDGGDIGGGIATSVVRIEISPLLLAQLDAAHVLDATQPSATAWVANAIESVYQAIKSWKPLPGNVAFMLAADAFELTNLDEGLLAFHLRFNCFTVMGGDNGAGDSVNNLFPGTNWRFREGKGWQRYNFETMLWYTLLNYGNPPAFAWDAGEAGPAPL